MITRLYTGLDNQSHLEDLELSPTWVNTTEPQQVTGITFRRIAPGTSKSWHNAPFRHYHITLEGAFEIGLGDGTLRRFGPGDILLAEDLTGQGHTTRILGDIPRVTVTVPLA
jgi:quercetin dioxygenase-like cupin family protein